MENFFTNPNRSTGATRETLIWAMLLICWMKLRYFSPASLKLILLLFINVTYLKANAYLTAISVRINFLDHKNVSPRWWTISFDQVDIGMRPDLIKALYFFLVSILSLLFTLPKVLEIIELEKTIRNKTSGSWKSNFLITLFLVSNLTLLFEKRSSFCSLWPGMLQVHRLHNISGVEVFNHFFVFFFRSESGISCLA